MHVNNEIGTITDDRLALGAWRRSGRAICIAIVDAAQSTGNCRLTLRQLPWI